MSGRASPGAVLEQTTLEQATEILKALGHPLRLSVILALAEHPRTVHELVELSGAAQPTVSQHLRVLRGARLVHGAREGREMIYRLVDEHVASIAAEVVDHAIESATMEGIPR